MTVDPTRVFLGWDQPVLPRVARWLLDAHPGDLGELTVIVPGRRSGRLLLSHLVAAAERVGVAVVPPRVVTPGALPELFYRPRRPIATRRERVLAWCEALSDRRWGEVDTEAPGAAVASSPSGVAAADDVATRLALARDLVRCQDELGEEGLRLADVLAGAPAALGAGGEAERWGAFAELERAELALLTRGGVDDPTAARVAALAAEGPDGEGPAVVLCCLVLQRGLERRFLARFASRVEALIAAPEREAASFDAWGGLDLAAWRRREVTVARESLVIADRPRGQARAVARRVAASLREDGVAGGARGGGRPGVTVGLADAALSPVIAEALADRAVAVHDAVGRPLAATAPWRLLQAVGRYVETRAPRELAALLRHPDLERRLAPSIEAAVAAAPEPATPELRRAVRGGDWLTLLDLYTSETAVESTAGPLPGDAAGAAAVAAAEAAIAATFGGAGELSSLGEWTARIRDFLIAVYGERDLGQGAVDRALAPSLRRLGEELREQAHACRSSDGGPRLRLVDAIELLVGEVAAEPLAAESPPHAVEVVGWLELPLDDAPRVVVAGLDEASASAALAGGLLSPPVRRTLGLQDAETLHLRDLYYLELLLASREVTLVTGRRGPQGEPLAPRRILLAGATPELVETVTAFWGESASEDEPEEEGPEGGGFRPILPRPDVAIPQRLPATAFRDYLACPYRFYLRHVLGLRQVRDLPRELLPGDFGRLLHAVLGAFARTAAASSDDAETIARALDDLLASEALLRSGGAPRVAVRLQLEQLRRRLRAFAAWQAQHVRAGWSIDPELVEVRVEGTLDVDGEPFVVTGRIDRVDRHPTAGARLLDYKSAEQSVTPEQAHRAGRAGERRWIDLQLPLYELMLRQRGGGGALSAGARGGQPLELGFVNLGHRLSAEPLALSGWSAGDLAEALATARDVVRAIRARRFWPPGEPPSYLDGFEGLAGDAFPDRARFLSTGS